MGWVPWAKTTEEVFWVQWVFLVHAACQDNPHVFSIQVRRKSIMIFLCNKYNSCRPLQPILNKGLESTIRPISHHFYQHLCKITFHVYIYLITTYCPTYSKMLLSGFDFNITSPFSFSSSKTRGFFFSGLSTKKKKKSFSTPCQKLSKMKQWQGHVNPDMSWL